MKVTMCDFKGPTKDSFRIFRHLESIPKMSQLPEFLYTSGDTVG